METKKLIRNHRYVYWFTFPDLDPGNLLNPDSDTGLYFRFFKTDQDLGIQVFFDKDIKVFYR